MKLRRASGVGLLLVVTACNQGTNGSETANVAEPASSDVVDTVASTSTLVTTTLSETTTTSASPSTTPTTTVPSPMAVSPNGNPTLLGGPVPSDGPLYFLSEDPAWTLLRESVTYGSLTRFPLVVVSEGDLAQRARVKVSVGPGGPLDDSANTNSATMGAVIEPTAVGGVATLGRTSMANGIPITELKWPVANGYSASMVAVGLDLEQAADLAEHIDVDGTTPSLGPSTGYRVAEADANPLTINAHFTNDAVGMDVTCSNDGDGGLIGYQMASLARTTSSWIAGALVAERADPTVGPESSALSGAHWVNGRWWCIVWPMTSGPNDGLVPVVDDEQVRQFLTTLVVVDEVALRAGAPEADLLLDPGPPPPPPPPPTDGAFSTGRAGTMGLPSARFTPDGSRIAVIGNDLDGFLVQFIDAETGAALASFPTTSGFLSTSGLVVSPNGELAFDGASLRDTATGDVVVDLGTSGTRTGADFSPDGRTIVVGGARNRTAAVYSTTTGEELMSHTLQDYDGSIAEFFPDGRRILLASHIAEMWVWDAVRDQEVLEMGVDDRHIFLVSPDGRFMATDGTGGQLVDATNGEVVLDLVGWPTAFSPNGDRLAVEPLGDGGMLTIWDVETLSKSTELPCGCTLRAGSLPTFSPDGSRIVTVRDGAGEIYDTATGELISTLVLDDATVLSAAYSPDGTRIVTANSNGTVRIWDDQ